MPEKSPDQLSLAEAKAELKRLAAEIAEHDVRYHQQDAPTISDAAYDKLRQRNAALEERFPELVLADTPSKRVGAAPQEKFGKGKVMTGEQVRWGLEHLNIDEARQKALGAYGMFPTVKTSCDDHEGSGAVKVQQWDGKAWKAITPNWVVGDRALTRKLLEESSLAYAAEKKITPACMN